MSFTYDAQNDVVTASFTDVVLANSADVLRWQREVEGHFAKFGRKVDLLIDLAGLMVKPGASRTFGKCRASVLSRFTLRSFRFNGDTSTRTSVFTSSVIEGAAANVYDSREKALQALLEDRERSR